MVVELGFGLSCQTAGSFVGLQEGGHHQRTVVRAVCIFDTDVGMRQTSALGSLPALWCVPTPEGLTLFAFSEGTLEVTFPCLQCSSTCQRAALL